MSLFTRLNNMKQIRDSGKGPGGDHHKNDAKDNFICTPSGPRGQSSIYPRSPEPETGAGALAAPAPGTAPGAGAWSAVTTGPAPETGSAAATAVAPATDPAPLPALPGAREVTMKFGSCLLLEDSGPGCFSFPEKDDDPLLSNLQLVRGVGPVNEARLKNQGQNNVSDLTGHPRWGQEAQRVYELIQKQKYRELQKLGARDREWLCLFQPGDVVFLDIESTGLWASQPLFLIGLLYFRGGRMVTRQFFARHYQEEKAALAAAHQLLQEFKIIVTFNGKRFDVPYIAGRSVAHRLYYSYPHQQVDLLYHARRLYSGKLPDCRLVTLEEHLLDFKRQDDIPGYLIPETYHRYTQKKDTGLILPVLEHNKLDLIAMARLFDLVGQE